MNIGEVQRLPVGLGMKGRSVVRNKREGRVRGETPYMRAEDDAAAAKIIYACRDTGSCSV